MAIGELEMVLDIGGFDVDRGVEMTLIQRHINIQKRDLGGGRGMPGEFDEVVAIEAFRELGEGVGTMKSEEEDFH